MRACVCVCKREGEGGEDVPAGPAAPYPRPGLPASLPPPVLPRAVGAIMTRHIQTPGTGHSCAPPLPRGRRRQGRGPPPAGYFGDIYLFSPVAQSVTAGAPGAGRRGSKCSGSMSFGVRGGRRGPRIKAHPINPNFGSAWLAVRGPAGEESFVGAGKANTPPAPASAVVVCVAV